jgi:hypothetical protein
MLRLRAAAFAVLLLALVAGAPALAEEPFRYPASTHGRGELRIVNSSPAWDTRRSSGVSFF